MRDHWQSYLISGIVIVLVVALRFRRLNQTRPLKLEQLWVVPAIYLAAVVVVLVQTPPDVTGALWCGVALVVGGLIGWWRGRLINISVDPATHTLNQKNSIATFAFLAALLLLRFGLRTVISEEALNWKISPAIIIDIFMLFALGLFAVQRLEMFLRGRKLLLDASRNRTFG